MPKTRVTGVVSPTDSNFGTFEPKYDACMEAILLAKDIPALRRLVEDGEKE